MLAAPVANDAALGTLDDLSVVRAALEAVIARDAVTEPAAEDVAHLGDAMQLMRDTIGNQPDFGRADVVFHTDRRGRTRAPERSESASQRPRDPSSETPTSVRWKFCEERDAVGPRWP